MSWWNKLYSLCTACFIRNQNTLGMTPGIEGQSVLGCLMRHATQWLYTFGNWHKHQGCTGRRADMILLGKMVMAPVAVISEE